MNQTGNVQQPTVGRMVWVIPSLEEQSTRTGKAANGADHIPAVVTQVFEGSWNSTYTGINCVATAVNGGTFPLLSIQHATTAMDGAECWVWPEIKKPGDTVPMAQSKL